MTLTPQYQYMIGTYGDSASRTGTLSVSGASTAVSGSGTAFLTEILPYDVLYCAGQMLFVKTVTSDGALVLQVAAGAAISNQTFTYKRLTNVETLASGVAPKSYYRPYVSLVLLGSGLTRELGRPVAEWRYMFIARAFRDALRAFCTTSSKTVLIRTRVNDNADEWDNFLADMFWPDEADKQAGRRMNFTIQFKNLRVS
jgi:hypothetical protein